MKTGNKIFIKNYIVHARHGYYKEEHYKTQRFVTSVICEVSENGSGSSDNLKDTFNYEVIRNAIDEVLHSDGKKLLEHLAENIAMNLLSYDIVQSVEVEMSKPDVWGDCSPGVNIFRSK